MSRPPAEMNRCDSPWWACDLHCSTPHDCAADRQASQLIPARAGLSPCFRGPATPKAALNVVFGDSESREVLGGTYRAKPVLALDPQHKDPDDLKGHVFRSRSRHLRTPDKGCAGDSASSRIIHLAVDSTNSGASISVKE